MLYVVILCLLLAGRAPQGRREVDVAVHLSDFPSASHARLFFLAYSKVVGTIGNINWIRVSELIITPLIIGIVGKKLMEKRTIYR